MAEILLVNPRKRKTSRKRRTAAQKRATAKMIAANRRRRNPAPAARAVNPRRRKRRASTALAAYKPRRRRSYRRNPIGNLSGMLAPVSDAALMAAGAVGIHAGWSYLAPMLPPSVRSLGLGNVLKGATALAVGQLVLPMVVSRATARQLTTGAIAAVISGFAWSQLRPMLQSEDATTDGLGTWLDRSDPNLGQWLDSLGTTAVGYDAPPAVGYLPGSEPASTGLYDPTSLDY